ncbi:unnamed protein product [Brachionus calyciflorus]|uniref:Protein SPEC3 n=1 Tax=Brachionus calyciflorus TaxID=104777 RepID=A0A813QSK0_9BILA|nr:unnamed protein product [Brachionus calyciflorus]
MKSNEFIVNDLLSDQKKSQRPESNDDVVKSGFFRRAIPIMPKYLAILCCILNILFPGLGTFISSFTIFCCASHKCDTNLKAFLTNFLAFILQLCSAIILIGWVWSIKYGLLFVHLSDQSEDELTPDAELPMYVRRHSSMDASLMYNTKPRLSTLALAKVKEEDS